MMKSMMKSMGSGSVVLDNNVETFAPGSPIFAVSSHDHLTLFRK
jgi:hypothetical protein